MRLQKASKDSAGIEKEMTQKVRCAQMLKYYAESQAQRLDEELMITEIEAIISQKLIDMFEIIEGTALDDVKNIEKETSLVRGYLKNVEEMATNSKLALKEKVAAERLDTVASLKSNLEKHPNNSKIIEGVIKTRKGLYRLTLDTHELGGLFDVIETRVKKGNSSAKDICSDISNSTKKCVPNVSSIYTRFINSSKTMVEKISYEELFTHFRDSMQVLLHKYSDEISHWKVPTLIICTCVILVAVESRSLALVIAFPLFMLLISIM